MDDAGIAKPPYPHANRRCDQLEPDSSQRDHGALPFAFDHP